MVLITPPGQRRRHMITVAPTSMLHERMALTRREALAHLSALLATPFVRWPERLIDPLAGTIAEYQAGRVRRDWTAAEVTAQSLERCSAWNATLHAVDQLSAGALDDARASDA